MAIGKEIKDQKHIAQVANSLGKLFEKSENNEKAVESYRVSLEYNRKLKLHKFVKEIEEKIKKLGGS
ncbi:MAG TPA: hypothetical protein PLV58_06465 [Campylobacterales bacterium]|nr:hypothetical protein [Campylobacterales bacterium]